VFCFHDKKGLTVQRYNGSKVQRCNGSNLQHETCNMQHATRNTQPTFAKATVGKACNLIS